MGVALAAGPSSAENSMIFGPAGVVGPACPSLSHSILVSMASPLFLTPHLPCFLCPLHYLVIVLFPLHSNCGRSSDLLGWNCSVQALRRPATFECVQGTGWTFCYRHRSVRGLAKG